MKIMAKRVPITDPQELSSSDIQSESASRVGHEDAAIAEVAYRLWHERGCPIGSPEIDWFGAQELLSHRAQSAELPNDSHRGEAAA